MKLYLVQHARALSKEEDPERPLSEEGRKDVARMAAFLERAGVSAERVIHSGRLRARQTAESLAAAMAPGAELETSGLLDPDEDPRALDWQSESWDRDTLIVGHLPYMARLVSHLVVDDDRVSLVCYEPGSVVCLERNGEGQWCIRWMIRPELLR